MTARSTLLRSSLLALAGAAALPASAQYYYGPGYGYAPGYGPPAGYYSYNAPPPPGREYGRDYDDEYMPARAPRPLPARVVIDRLEDMGYRRIGQPRFTGTLYVVIATEPGGARQQITVDAIRGIVLNSRIVALPGPGLEDEAAPPRRYGARPLDTDELRGDPDEPTIAPAPRPRREAGRPAPIESQPLPPPNGPRAGSLPPPADPRLDPSNESSAKVAPRPFEGRSGSRQARTEPPAATKPPTEAGPRPFGINPSQGSRAGASNRGEERKSGQPTTPEKKPVAEARPPAPNKPVRVIQGVTPLNTGESRSQLDSLPRPPDPPAPTGE
jgi:hypothetical protein